MYLVWKKKCIIISLISSKWSKLLLNQIKRPLVALRGFLNSSSFTIKFTFSLSKLRKSLILKYFKIIILLLHSLDNCWFWSTSKFRKSLILKYIKIKACSRCSDLQEIQLLYLAMQLLHDTLWSFSQVIITSSGVVSCIPSRSHSLTTRGILSCPPLLE